VKPRVASILPQIIAFALGGLVFPGLAAERPDGKPTPAPIRTTAQLRKISQNDAATGIPVVLNGVVTFNDAEHGIAFLQDSGGAVFFSPEGLLPDGKRQLADLKAGDRVELSGISREGGYSPILAGRDQGLVDIKVRGRGGMPVPVHVDRGTLIRPELDAMWVQVDGVVESETVLRDRRILEIRTGYRTFRAVFSGPANDVTVPTDLLGADVRVTGVYGSLADESGQLSGFQLFVPSPKFLQVLDRAGVAAFSQAPLTVPDLLRFRHDAGARVRMNGIVVGSFPDRRIFLDVEGEMLEVRPREAGDLPVPGAHLTVAGVPVFDAEGPRLVDTLLRTEGTGPEPQPAFTRLQTLAAPVWRNRLVEIDATLTGKLQRDGGVELLLEDQGRSVRATLATAPGERPVLPAIGSWVRATGICQSPLPDRQASAPDLAEAGPAVSLLLRSAADVQELRPPPFWTSNRVLAVGGIVLIVVTAALAWVTVLRERVRKQTEIIAEKVERERVGEERARIARELHDTLEQELAGIGMQLDLAASRIATQPERARQPVEMALQMLRRSQAEARRSIMNLRSGLLDQQDLAQALHELAPTLKRPGRPPVDIEITGTPRKLATSLEHNLLRIVQEALNNIFKHAGATEVRVRLDYEAECIRLEIQDNGSGFEPQNAGGGAHFGLRGMRERAGKVGGKFTVESAPGAGTRITIETVALLPGSGQNQDSFSPRSQAPT